MSVDKLTASFRYLSEALNQVTAQLPATIKAVTGEFNTLTEAIATDILPNVQWVHTHGYSQIDDNGGAYYKKVVALPAQGGFQSADLAFWELFGNQIITPEMFGASPALSDNYASFLVLNAYLNRVVTAYVRFAPNAIYSIWPGTPPDQGTTFRLTTTRGVTFDMQGSYIKATGTWAAGKVSYFFYVEDSNQFSLINARFTSDQMMALAVPVDDRGARWINLLDDTKNVILINVELEGGLTGITGQRHNANQFIDGITVLNYRDNKVFYPLNLQKAGDNLFVRNWRSENSGRSYFCYNVNHHDVEIDDVSQGIILPSCPIGVVVDSAETDSRNTHSDIKLSYRLVNTGQTATVGDMLDLFYQQTAVIAEGKGFIRDIDIHLDIDMPTVVQLSSLIITQKLNNVGANDPTTRNHVMENVNIHGSVRCNGQTVRLIELFTDGANYAGERIRNIRLRDLSLWDMGRASIVADCSPFTNTSSQGTLLLENILSLDNGGGTPEAEIQLTNVQPGGLMVNNVRAPNFTTTGAFTPVWTSNGVLPVLNDGTLTGYGNRVENRIRLKIELRLGPATTIGTGAYIFQLPAPWNYVTIAQSLGEAMFSDVSTGNQYDGMIDVFAGTSDIFIANVNGTGAYWGSASPVVPANGDILRMVLDIEV